MIREYAIAAIAVAAIWALCAWIHPAVRSALVNGARCMGRHPDVWRIPAAFGFGYAIFHLAAAALLHWRAGDLAQWQTAVEWRPQPHLWEVLVPSLLPAAESAASVFTIFIATFPLSSLAALLLLANFRGLLVEMSRSLLRRMGRLAGSLVTALVILAALAAVADPAVYLLLPEINELTSFTALLAVNFLAVIFELLLGIFLLTYIMLMAYAWMRGLHFERAGLMHLAMRRSGFVVKWSLPLAVLTTLLITAPLDLGIFFEPDDPICTATTWFAEWIGRPVITAIALIFCSVQAILVFHNESLRRALSDSLRLLRRRWLPILLFIGATCASFLPLGAALSYATQRLGMESPVALCVRVAAAWIEAMLAGWLIAGWVCLYKSLSAGRKEIPF